MDEKDTSHQGLESLVLLVKSRKTACVCAEIDGRRLTSYGGGGDGHHHHLPKSVSPTDNCIVFSF